VMAPRWPMVGGVWVTGGNRMTRRMIRLLSGEILGGEPDPNLLGLGFAEFGVGEVGSTLWYDVAGQSLIIRSAIPLVRGSTTGDPLSYPSVAGVLTSPTTVNGVMPSVVRPTAHGQLVSLGCRTHRTVAAAVRAAMAWVILVVKVPWVSTVGVVSSPLVRSYGGVGAADV
jgi:hypothetical protein